MTLLTTDIIAIIIALVGLIGITFHGLFTLRKLEIENRNLRKEILETKWNQIKI
jgi:hypothetical protein